MMTGFHVYMNFFLLQESFTAALKRSPFACSLRTRTTTLIGRDTALPPATLNTPRTRVPAWIGPAQSRVGNRPTIRQSFMKSSFCHKKLIFTASLRKENFWNFPPEQLLPKSSCWFLKLSWIAFISARVPITTRSDFIQMKFGSSNEVFYSQTETMQAVPGVNEAGWAPFYWHAHKEAFDAGTLRRGRAPVNASSTGTWELLV